MGPRKLDDSLEFSSRSLDLALGSAYDEVVAYHHKDLKPAHLLLGILRARDAQTPALLRKKRIDAARLEERLRQSLRKGKKRYAAAAQNGQIVVYSSKESDEILRHAEGLAVKGKAKHLRADHLLAAILRMGPKRVRELIRRSRY